MEKRSRKEEEQERRRQEIIDAAEESFSEKGYDGVSMDSIAKSARYTKRTIYKYFSGKEDLFFAVALRAYESLKSHMRSAAAEGANGYEKLAKAGIGFYRFYTEEPERFFLMNQVGKVNQSGLESEYRQRWLASDAELFSDTSGLIREGREDGSLAPASQSAADEYTVSFLITAFFHLYSLNGKAYTGHFKLSEQGFIEKSMAAILEPLKKK